MKNREYLLQTNTADILKTANKRLLWLHCDCILAVMDDAVGIDRCKEFDADCNKCIESWLNEERMQT